MSIFRKIFGLFGGGSGKNAKAADRRPVCRARYELLAIDIDGTLVDSKRQLTEPVIQAVKRAHAAGVRVVLSTARPPVNTREILQALDLDTQMVCYNGAVVCEGKTLEVIHHWALPAEIALKAAQMARKINPKVQIRIDIADKWYTDRYTGQTAGPKAPAAVEPLEKILTQPVSRLTLVGEEEPNRLVREMFQKQFGDRVGIQYTDPRLLQIMVPEADKAAALQKVADHYGIAREKVMAIGDAPNDLSMMVWAGCAVAVANSYKEVLEAARYRVASNDKHGVAEAIDRYVLAGA